jgi:hypothetical protein
MRQAEQAETLEQTYTYNGIAELHVTQWDPGDGADGADFCT